MAFAPKLPNLRASARTALLIALSAPGVGALLAGCGNAGEESWAESLDYAASLRPTLESIDYDRESLLDGPVDGSVDGRAFAAYDEAIDLLLPEDDPEAPTRNELMNVFMRIWSVHYGTPGGLAEQDLAAAEAFLGLPRVQRGLVALSEGARRRDARPSIDWSAPSADVEDVLAYRLLSLVAISHGDALARDGRDAEAVDWFLRGAQLGLDQLHSPLPTHAMMGEAILVSAFFGPAGGTTTLIHLGREARQRLAMGLDQVLDRHDLSPLIAAGDFVLHMHHAQEFGKLPGQHSYPDDGVLEHEDLVAWLQDRRGVCRAVLGGASTSRDRAELPGTFGRLQENSGLVRHRLAALQLALRVDLDEGASRIATSNRLGLTATVTEDQIAVSLNGAGLPVLSIGPVEITRSPSR
jgi:hypothetical protein